MEETYILNYINYIVNSEWRISTPRFASTPQRRNENIQYFISLNGNRTYNLSVIQLHTDASALRLASNLQNLAG